MDFSSSGKEPRHGNTKSGSWESLRLLDIEGGGSSGRLIGPQQTESLISFPPFIISFCRSGRDKAAGEMESGWT